jgi:hypothetical protein
MLVNYSFDNEFSRFSNRKVHFILGSQTPFKLLTPYEFICFRSLVAAKHLFILLYSW